MARDVEFTPTARLKIMLTSTGNDRLFAGGDITLAGTLRVSDAGGAIPSGRPRTIVQASQILGNFTTEFVPPGYMLRRLPGRIEIVRCPADFNGDEFLDFFEYDDFVRCFETGVCPPDATADFNGDDFADVFDYDDFVEAFESGC